MSFQVNPSLRFTSAKSNGALLERPAISSIVLKEETFESRRVKNQNHGVTPAIIKPVNPADHLTARLTTIRDARVIAQNKNPFKTRINTLDLDSYFVPSLLVDLKGKS